MVRIQRFFIDVSFFVWILVFQVWCSTGNHKILFECRSKWSMNTIERSNPIFDRYRSVRTWIGVIPRNWTNTKSGVRWSLSEFDCLVSLLSRYGSRLGPLVSKIYIIYYERIYDISITYLQKNLWAMKRQLHLQTKRRTALRAAS